MYKKLLCWLGLHEDVRVELLYSLPTQHYKQGPFLTVTVHGRDFYKYKCKWCGRISRQNEEFFK